MTTEQKISAKKNLQQHCVAIIEQHVTNARTAMESAQSAANNESKSSAGDKYETGRAMGHLEKDMYAKQLAANNIELAALLNIDCNKLYETVATGSLVECDEFSFFIAAGLGKITREGKTIYLLSPNAPVAKLLFNKIIGDTIEFNKQKIIIRDIY